MSRLPLTASSMLGLLKKRFMSCEYVSPTGGRMGWGIGLVSWQMWDTTLVLMPGGQPLAM